MRIECVYRLLNELGNAQLPSLHLPKGVSNKFLYYLLLLLEKDLHHFRSTVVNFSPIFEQAHAVFFPDPAYLNNKILFYSP